jgi:CRISPR-associated Csx2 family protein
MKIISFLGFNSYQVTEYKHPKTSGICETKYYQEALAQFYQPEKMYIFLTPTVETKCPGYGDKKEDKSNWVQLRERFSVRFPEIEIIPVKDIPERNSPEDVWVIFKRVNECLEEGDRVIFDITHSFRSVPIVALLAVSYFRVVRNIQIEGLLYGAFEAKQDNITPSFDLLPVVGLFDWLTATDQFLKTGNGEDLAELLQKAGGHTQALGDRILEISQGLQLLRPMDVMKAAAALPNDIAQARDDLTVVVPPFELLLNRVVDEYGQFSLGDPQNYQINGKAALQKQLFEITWYVEKGLDVQALSLAREWLPSLLCYHFNLDPLIERPNRSEMEFLLSGGVQKDKETGEIVNESNYLEEWKKIDEQKRKLLLKLWGGQSSLAKLRNDVLHSGFRKNPKPVEEIKKILQDILSQLNEIAQVWGVFDD